MQGVSFQVREHNRLSNDPKAGREPILKTISWKGAPGRGLGTPGGVWCPLWQDKPSPRAQLCLAGTEPSRWALLSIAPCPAAQHCLHHRLSCWIFNYIVQQLCSPTRHRAASQWVSFHCSPEGRKLPSTSGSSKTQPLPLDPKPALHKPGSSLALLTMQILTVLSA